jgi:hypothetical protein
MAEGGRRPPGDGGSNVDVAVDLLWEKTRGWSDMGMKEEVKPNFRTPPR